MKGRHPCCHFPSSAEKVEGRKRESKLAELIVTASDSWSSKVKRHSVSWSRHYKERPNLFSNSSSTFSLLSRSLLPLSLYVFVLESCRKSWLAFWTYHDSPRLLFWSALWTHLCNNARFREWFWIEMAKVSERQERNLAGNPDNLARVGEVLKGGNSAVAQSLMH